MRFNGVDIKSVHKAISINKEIPPGMPARDLRTVLSARGEILTDVEHKQAEYTIKVNIAGRDKLMAWDVRKLLAAWATSSGNKTAILEPTHWPGIAYDAIAKTIEPPEFVFGFATLKVTFALLEPVAYELIPSIAKGNRETTMHIGGSWRTEPQIIFTASAAADGMTLKLDGNRFLKIKGSIAAGDVITADTKEGGLTINGKHAESRIDYTGTEWRPGFDPGIHKLTASAAGTVEARWSNRWA